MKNIITFKNGLHFLMQVYYNLCKLNIILVAPLL